MFFSKVIYSAVVLAGIVSGHSWLECSKVTSVDTNPAIVANVFTPMWVSSVYSVLNCADGLQEYQVRGLS